MNLTPLDAAVHPDPYPYYAKLVAERPVYFDTDLTSWVVSSATCVAEALQSAHCKVRPAGEPVPPGLLGSQAGLLFGHLVRMNDGEYHGLLKRLIHDSLASVDSQTLQAAARESVHRTLELTSPTRPGIGLTDYCYQAPAQTMGLLLGLPEAELTAAARLTSLLVRCISPGGTPQQVCAGREAAVLLWALFDELLAQDASNTRPGLLWVMQRRALQSGESLARDAVIANAIGFMTQAFESTTGLIGNTLLALADVDVKLRPPVHGSDSPGAMLAFVREVSRHDSPIQNTRRFATEGFQLGPAKVSPGDSLLLLLAAANRDPALHANPARRNPSRAPAALFSFGAARHQCPGQGIAETIVVAAVSQLLEAGLEPSQLHRPAAFRRSVNARVPELRLALA